MFVHRAHRTRGPRQHVNEALKEVEDETCSHFLGLYRRGTARSSTHRSGDNTQLTEEQKVLHISLNDFRALT